MMGSIDALVMSIMGTQTPALSELAKKVGDVADKFNQMPDSMKSTIAQGAALLAVLGPVLVIVGTMIMGLGGLVSAFGF